MQQQAHSSKVWFITGAARVSACHWHVRRWRRAMRWPPPRARWPVCNRRSATSTNGCCRWRWIWSMKPAYRPPSTGPSPPSAASTAWSTMPVTGSKAPSRHSAMPSCGATSTSMCSRRCMCCATRCRTCAHSAAACVQRGLHRRLPGRVCGLGQLRGQQVRAGRADQTLAAELAELNIKATVVYPGPVRTGFLSRTRWWWLRVRLPTTPKPRPRWTCT